MLVAWSWFFWNGKRGEGGEKGWQSRKNSFRRHHASLLAVSTLVKNQEKSATNEQEREDQADENVRHTKENFPILGLHTRMISIAHGQNASFQSSKFMIEYLR